VRRGDGGHRQAGADKDRAEKRSAADAVDAADDTDGDPEGNAVNLGA